MMITDIGQLLQEWEGNIDFSDKDRKVFSKLNDLMKKNQKDQDDKSDLKDKVTTIADGDNEKLGGSTNTKAALKDLKTVEQFQEWYKLMEQNAEQNKQQKLKLHLKQLDLRVELCKQIESLCQEIYVSLKSIQEHCSEIID